MKSLNGKDLAEFIKVRQASQVRNLQQSYGIRPKLAIIITSDNPVINVYVRLKQSYGQDIGIAVEIHKISQSSAEALIEKLNTDDAVHGIIVQLPLKKPEDTEKIVNLIAPDKDVDALGSKAGFDAATAQAILWLLNGYNIELKNKKILLIGLGKLVGKPLYSMLQKSNIQASVADETTKDLASKTLNSDIIISATGSPGLLKSNMISPGTVVVDAGLASENGQIVGDVAPEVHNRSDLTLTPLKGGVGPLTVAALFDNVIRACYLKHSKNKN